MGVIDFVNPAHELALAQTSIKDIVLDDDAANAVRNCIRIAKRKAEYFGVEYDELVLLMDYKDFYRFDVFDFGVETVLVKDKETDFVDVVARKAPAVTVVV